MLPALLTPFRIAGLLLTLSLFPLTGFAQVEDPVSWDFSVESVTDTSAVLLFQATIEDSWHVYSMEEVPGGPIPTRIELIPSPEYAVTSDPEILSPYKEVFDKGFGLTLNVFEKTILIRQAIHFSNAGSFAVRGMAEYMSCNDLNCLPPKQAEFSLFIGENSGGTAPSFEENRETGLHSFRQDFDSVPSPETGSSLWHFFLIAFIAGLAGIFTPCVFPMIPMTVSFFLKGEKRSGGILRAGLFGFSIIAIYTSLGILLGLTGAGAGLAGQISTHWIPNLLFFLLFLVFALSFLGMFEITLPAGLANRADQQADKGGLFSVFFMALTLVIVSFSCTGPIVGALLVESATGGLAWKPVLGMFGFSLAFALPFTLLAIFPSRLKTLPKSGSWLNTVKTVMGFLLLAFSVKFLSVMDQVYHLGWISREIFLSFWIAVAGVTGAYLLGKVPLKQDNGPVPIGTGRLLAGLGVLTLALYMVPGLWGARLNALSAFLPPASSEALFQPGSSAAGASGSSAGTLCETPLYGDFLAHPHSLEGYFDYAQGMACARTLGKPVLLNFKGHACSNCKIMEAEVLSNAEVLKLIREEYVLISLYTDDRTVLPESRWVQSSIDGKLKKTMGQINTDLEISKFGANTMPLYVLLDPEGNPLTAPLGFTRDTDAFLDFLKKGMKMK